MPLRQSIATRIFGLAVFLLVLTLALVGFLLVQVRQLSDELAVVVERDLPLESSFGLIHEYGLRRRLAFERWQGELASGAPQSAAVAEASANYEQFGALVDAELARAHRLLEQGRHHAQDREVVVELGALLRQIERTRPLTLARQRAILDAHRAGDPASARLAMQSHAELQVLLQGLREEAREKSSSLARLSTEQNARRQSQIVWLTLAATLSTVLLGLAVAALVTSRLVRPVRRLTGAIRDVREGNLQTQLPVPGRDEIGLLTESFNFFVSELRSKEQLRTTFGKYIDPRVLERVIANPQMAEADGGRQVMTVGFGDLVGFTAISERLTPAVMVRLLNRHFELQARAVQSHGGVVDKFIGDAIMAFWGPPFVAPEQHALLACRAALAQLRALDELRAELPELTGLRRDLPVLDCRIGLCTGDVVVGNIGADSARSYTVIGDTVNLASRLEGANRAYGTHILLAEDTARAVEADLVLRPLDALAVKGRREAVRVFELLGTREGLSAERAALLEAFAAAMAHYHARAWDAAEAAFGACLRVQPDDGPSLVFAERVRQLRAAPPPADWDGVWTMTSK